MTHKCCVRDCEEIVKETRSKGLPLHKFPKDILLRNKWLASGGFDPNFKPTSSQIVCYKHFKQADYETGRSCRLFLKKGSIPTIFQNYHNHPDPIRPSPSFLSYKVHTNSHQFLKSSPSLDIDNLNNCLESSCSSFEASMDSSSSLQDSFTKKDSNSVTFTKNLTFKTLETDAVNEKEISANSETKNIKTNIISHQQTNSIASDKKKTKAVDSKSKIMSLVGLDFVPGSKLEAKDFNEKWYSARVVETDWIEREVLIHFDKWSSRFDEWIPMDSSRLRVLQLNSKEMKLKEFIIGEKILATWVDGKKYPAKVNASLGNDKYDVLFDDGYSKILKTSKMTKLVEVPMNKCEEKIAYLGSKQERRDKKRKHTVTELFYTNSKKKIKNDNEKVHRQDLSDVHDVKLETKSESLIESEKSVLDLESELYKNEEQYSGRINKIKRNIFSCNNANVVDKSSKWTNKHFERHSPNASEQDYATFIGHLRIEIEDSTYKCPKKGCNKNFRKENLLQMHIKHYHPEYSKFLGTTPNVADLAYARTIGESVEDLIPKKSRNPVQSNQIGYQVTSLISRNINSDICPTEMDNKLENKLSDESVNIKLEDNLFQQSNDCSMSPGRLFDIRFKEDKAHTGIKTLLPVKSLNQKAGTIEQFQCASICNDISEELYSNDDSVYKKQNMSLRDDNYDEEVESTLINKSSIAYHKYNNALDNKLELDNVENNQSKSDLVIMNGESIKVEKLRREEIINCTCGITEEDGLMIQCDLCLCWQHGHCNCIEKEKDVPEKYICYICQHSFRQRASKSYFHDQDWIHEGQLPSLHSYNSNTKTNENAAILKRSYDLIGGLLKIKDLLYSLRVKVNIAQSKDHPKLYLWAKNWNKIVIPNVKIESVPVIEIIKFENYIGEYNETLGKEKTELRFSPRNDNAQKLIASDTELMKILEEDSLQIEESKPQTKYSANIFKDEGRILLDALTKNGFDQQENRALNKTEVTHQESMKQKYATRYMASDKIGKSQIFLSETANKSFTLLQPTIPEPEEPIDPVECKLRLMEHIDHLQTFIDNTLNFIEIQLSTLEDLKSVKKQNSNSHIQTKQTILMLINDLNVIRKLADLF